MAWACVTWFGLYAWGGNNVRAGSASGPTGRVLGRVVHWGGETGIDTDGMSAARERGREGEGEGEKRQQQVSPILDLREPRKSIDTSLSLSHRRLPSIVSETSLIRSQPKLAVSSHPSSHAPDTQLALVGVRKHPTLISRATRKTTKGETTGLAISPPSPSSLSPRSRRRRGVR
ncbi:hypothetical protein DB88DRAFT_64904 [Papiliotrema laurentii]|uniref:Uncharacterized protein n=1 Tax=Papiliotrema laurentii TaxID=5418 RepID=A0AAD9FM61_PAPLA|nr:hypothetical protein DB88DRAFT_64904 [Papiliotrema laurentii]